MLDDSVKGVDNSVEHIRIDPFSVVENALFPRSEGLLNTQPISVSRNDEEAEAASAPREKCRLDRMDTA